ncbi:uncharacterized protein BKA55DRAFT_714082, partial [Fusarium redolens]
IPAIKNTSVLVIGGSSGIGYGVANKALAEGARVHIVSSNPSRLEQSVAALKQKHIGADVSSQPCDLVDPNVERNLEKVLESIEPLDHIVYTAGDALAIVPLAQINLDSIHKASHIRFTVPLLLAKLAPRYLKLNYRHTISHTPTACSA